MITTGSLFRKDNSENCFSICGFRCKWVKISVIHRLTATLCLQQIWQAHWNVGTDFFHKPLSRVIKSHKAKCTLARMDSRKNFIIRLKKNRLNSWRRENHIFFFYVKAFASATPCDLPGVFSKVKSHRGKTARQQRLCACLHCVYLWLDWTAFLCYLYTNRLFRGECCAPVATLLTLDQTEIANHWTSNSCPKK